MQELTGICVVIVCVFFNSFCVFGKRLIQMNDTKDCTSSFLRQFYCTNRSDTSCDPYFLNDQNKPHVVKGIKGLTSGVLRGLYRFSL